MTDRLKLPPLSGVSLFFALAVFFLFGAGVAAFLVADPFGLGWFGGAGGGGGTPEAASADAPTHDHAADGSLWTCPMHPEVVETEPGSCPICNMALVEVEPATGTADAAEAGTLWTCPMHPEVIEPQPGNCPICNMALVETDAPAATDAASGSAGGSGPDARGVVHIDPVQVQNIGVASELAVRRDLARVVRTVGILDYDAERVEWVNTKFDGWIEKVHVTYIGQRVQPGTPLFEIYSPELVTTQEEYLRALEYLASMQQSGRKDAALQAEGLVHSTRERLRYWDIDETQIETLEHSRSVQRTLTVDSPTDGVVTEIMDQALEGRFVKAGMNLYRLADLASVWVHADVYESDFPWIEDGLPATVELRHEPERTRRGRVLFLYPELNAETRTLKVCIELPNPGLALRPGMYADVTIQGPPIRDALTIPESAVLRTGERELVFVDAGGGRFEPRRVELGARGGDGAVQVLDGVEAGEAVVTQAQFLLDSESRVQEALARFRARARGAS